MNYEQLCQRLSNVYDTGEAKAIVRWVLDVRFGLSTADIYCGKVTQLSPNDQAELEKIMQRLEKAEPVQYVLGVADFCGRQFHVAPGVLIPRPETAELCHLIANDGGADILDIGTGSGCIAITLALDIADSKVSAWDISDDALAIAQQNAKTLGADVSFEKRDALNISKTSNIWDVIVSNPPYICRKEAAEMEENVLKYEPDTALFVPDDDPLLFYRHIMNYAVSALRQEGRLYFEINPIYADSIVEQLQQLGFADVQKIDDQFGKTRFIKACKKMKEKTEQEAYLQLAAVCAHAEHCEQEMRDKMKRWGMDKDAQERVVARLVKERYIDNERYARAFVKDRIRYNKWGQRKVRQALWLKRIDEDVQKNVLDEIDEKEYLDVLIPLLKQKRKTTKANSDYELNQKLVRFALSRGFDFSIIRQCLEVDEDVDYGEETD